MVDLKSDRWNRRKKPKNTASPEAIAKAKKPKKELVTKNPDKLKVAAAKVKQENAVKLAGTEASLAPVAKEINHRLQQAEKNQSQADDHRLAAALRLAEAKKAIEAAGGRFKTWAEKNVASRGWESVRKLAYVGMDENPAEALKAMRESNNRRNKELRARRDLPRSIRTQVRNTPVADQPAVTALAAIERMPDDQRLKLIQSVAGNEGLKVIAAGADAPKSNIVVGGLDGLKAAFSLLSPPLKMQFAQWAAEKVGAKLELPSFEADIPRAVSTRDLTDGERKLASVAEAEPEMPSFLKRERRTPKTQAAQE